MSFSLPPQVAEALHRAFLASFPSEGELHVWLEFRLAKNLNEVAGDSLPLKVLNLLYWVEAEVSWPWLLAAGAATPDRPLLRQECEAALKALPPPANPPP